MSITLNANQTPAIQLGSFAANAIYLARQSASGTAPSSPNFQAGTLLVSALNEISQRLDMLSVIPGGRIFALASDGLVITPGTGLSVNISAGHVSMLGIPELSAAIPGKPVNDNAQNYLWLAQPSNGPAPTVTVVPNSLTPPTGGPFGAFCYLGRVTTASGAVTQIDTSGVMYADGGGLRYRQTNDAGLPTDTPPAGCPPFLTQTNTSGTYVWNVLGPYHEIFSAPGTLPLTVQNINQAGADVGSPLTSTVFRLKGVTWAMVGGELVGSISGVTDTDGG